MKIINLIEDTKGKSNSICEHGLSFYIETKGHKLLLDTGASDAFIHNAMTENIDLVAVDAVIISHGHYDHAGGVLAFAKINPNATIYINQNAVGEFYNLKNSRTKYIGMDRSISLLPQVKFTSGNFDIDDGISVFTNADVRRSLPRGNKMLRRKTDAGFVRDDFCHEQYLVVREGDKRVLLSGCAHRGILNILDEYNKIYGDEPTHVISGFHTSMQEYTKEDDDMIRQTARELADMNTLFYTGHCTGEHPMELMKEIMGERIAVIHSGDELI